MGNRNDLLKSKFKSFVATYILSYYYAKSKLLFWVIINTFGTPFKSHFKHPINDSCIEEENGGGGYTFWAKL